MSKKPFIAILFIGLLIGIFMPVVIPGGAEADFIAYWSSSRLLIEGKDPYDQDALSELQRSVRPGRFEEQGIVISAWNPPWLMLLFAPLGVLRFNTAVQAWVATSLVLTGISIALAWDMVVKPFHERGFLLLFGAGLLFSNTVVMVMLGQITSIALFSTMFAAWLIQKGRDGWAGAVLLLLLIKPHLSFLFLFTIFIWVITKRRWKVLLGLAISAIVSIIVFTVIYPPWISAYLTLLSHIPYSAIDTSTFGSFVQARSGISTFRFIGVLLLPFGFWLSRLLRQGHWLTVINLSTMITLPFAPYGFGVDQVLLLPVVVEVTGWLFNRVHKLWQLIVILVSPLAFSILWLVLTPHNVPNHSLWWIPLAFLLIYWPLRRITHR